MAALAHSRTLAPRGSCCSLSVTPPNPQREDIPSLFLGKAEGEILYGSSRSCLCQWLPLVSTSCSWPMVSSVKVRK